jgi:hypothetical protein
MSLLCRRVEVLAAFVVLAGICAVVVGLWRLKDV